MDAKEAERPFVERIGEYLLSLPYDLKVLQEAVTDPDLDRKAREIAAGTIIHTLMPQEGEAGPLRYVDDVLFVRAALRRIIADGGEGADAFAGRFTEIYGKIESDGELFGTMLGPVWPWASTRIEAFAKLPWKGKKSAQYLDDEEAASSLYEDGLEFETNYPVNDEMVKNRVKRCEPILEVLQKRHAEDAKKKA